jgi:hypothetical protein
MSLLIANGYVSDNAYSYSYPQHLHRHRWQEADKELLLKKMVKEYDLLIKKGTISYYFIEVVRVDFEAEQSFSSEIISKKVPLKEKVQLNKEAKGKQIPRVARFTINSDNTTVGLWDQLHALQAGNQVAATPSTPPSFI